MSSWMTDIGHLAALLATVVVRLLGERGDEGRQVPLFDGDHPRWAGEGVVDGDARGLETQGDIGERAVGCGARGRSLLCGVRGDAVRLARGFCRSS